MVIALRHGVSLSCLLVVQVATVFVGTTETVSGHFPNLTFSTAMRLPSRRSSAALVPLRGGGEDEVSGDVERKDRALIQKLQGLRNEAAALSQRRMMLDQEVEDHFLVTETLKNFDGSRRCYRSVGGVLMESTVGEVQPAVSNELEMLSKAMEELTTKILQCQKTIAEFQKKHSIRIVSGSEEE
mmetsp:Transcript_43596/g.87629  ORF Transcript_43596/g.87629 Transcript_43596/m.87629 type:complete len:184 (-) Transcript_43596:46-597(-)